MHREAAKKKNIWAKVMLWCKRGRGKESMEMVASR
jgi:hypothetical protein